jgi:hypothetical protein
MSDPAGVIAKTVGQFRNRKEDLLELYSISDTKTKINLVCNNTDLNSLSKAWQITLTCLIALSIMVFVTASQNQPVYDGSNLTDEQYEIIEVFLTIIFLLEILVRMMVSKRLCGACISKISVRENDEEPLISENPFFYDALNWIDIIAVSPYFLEKMIMSSGQTTDQGAKNTYLALSLVRLLRMLRIFKIFRQLEGAKILYQTALNAMEPLTLTMVGLFLFFTFVASLILMLEPCYTNDCVYKDVFNAGYFVIITLTTVGFGDQIPSNKMTRFVTVCTMLMGAVFLSMPIAVIGNSFEKAYSDFEKKRTLGDPILRKVYLKKQHEKNTKIRKQRILNSILGMLCYAKRLDRWHLEIKSRKSSSSMTSIGEDGEPPGDIDIYAEEGTSPSKYAVSVDEKDPKLSDRYLLSYRHAMLKKLHKLHTLFVEDCRELFDFSKLISGDESSIPLLRSRTLKSKPESDVQKTKLGRRSSLQVVGDTLAKIGALAGHTERENHVKIHHERLMAMQESAKGKLSMKDRVWILVEVPDSSKGSRRIYMTRWIVVFLSIMVTFLQTMPQTNSYGEDTWLCKTVVWQYCSRIHASGNVEYVKQNPACFAQGHYKGCIGDLKECAFPSDKYNMTCKVYEEYTQFIQTKEKRASVSCETNENFTTPLPFSDVYSLLPSQVPICERTVCNKTHFSDLSWVFAIIEMLIILFFVFEFIARIIVSRKPTTFLKLNILDTVCMFVTTLEFILVVASTDGFSYHVWGMPLMTGDVEPFLFRPLRLWVPIRFLLMAMKFKGVTICELTIKKVGGRMATPILFFFVCIVLFAGPLYVAELQEATVADCTNKIGNPTKCFHCKGNPCHVQDMFDAMWMIIVTMTTVGYGGKFPQTAIGKGVTMGAAIFGLFYLAMPLNIVGSNFYSIYTNFQEDLLMKSSQKKLGNAMLKVKEHRASSNARYVVDVMKETEDIPLDENHPENITDEDLKILQKLCLTTHDEIMRLEPGRNIHIFADQMREVVEIIAVYLNPTEHGIRHEVADGEPDITD